MKFTFPLPPPLNQTYKAGTTNGYNVVGGKVVGVTKARFYKDDRAHEWQKDAFFTIKEQAPKRIEGRAVVVIRWLLKTKRDIDAGEKLILDVLQMANVILNDDNFYSKLTEKYMVEENPRVEVYVKEEKDKRELFNQFI